MQPGRSGNKVLVQTYINIGTYADIVYGGKGSIVEVPAEFAGFASNLMKLIDAAGGIEVVIRDKIVIPFDITEDVLVWLVEYFDYYIDNPFPPPTPMMMYNKRRPAKTYMTKDLYPSVSDWDKEYFHLDKIRWDPEYAFTFNNVDHDWRFEQHCKRFRMASEGAKLGLSHMNNINHRITRVALAGMSVEDLFEEYRHDKYPIPTKIIELVKEQYNSEWVELY